MWKEVLVMLMLADAIFGATLGEHLETTSFEFLNKFSQKQYRSIVSLKISNASVNKIDPKFKYLRNLQYLDLSYNNVQISSLPSLINLKTLKLNGNNLKYINMTALPQNIEILDISNNLLNQIPKDWRSLRSLKTLLLHKNPIDCDCNNVLHYDRLIKSGIQVPETVACHSPTKYIGKDIGAVNCSLDDVMLYDEPDDGSGAPDIFEDNLLEDRMNVPFVYEDEQPENITIIDDKVPEEDLLAVSSTTYNSLDEAIEEGSGDEGSGLEIVLPESGVFGCIENCSTPGPVGANDEEHASPLPGFLDQAKIFFDDINVFKYFDETTTTTTSTTTKEPTTEAEPSPTPSISTTSKVIAKEPKILKESKPTLNHEPGKNKDVEVMTNRPDIGELEKASAVPKNSTAVYAVVGVLVFMAVLFLICFIKKRKAQRISKNRREVPKSLGEEMKPLSKSPIQAVNEKPVKNSPNIPEHIPLINGKNGTPKNDSPVLKTFTPLAHPEGADDNKDEEPQEEPAQQNGHSNVPEDVELRPKFQPELLTPQRERVTIRESEIPDSIPKTPLFVHRQKNSDGEIVTTVVP